MDKEMRSGDGEGEHASPVCYGHLFEDEVSDIRHEKAGYRFVSKEGATLDYILDDDRNLVVTHVEVPEACRGRGLAGSLMKSCLSFARREGLAVSATCTYAQAFLSRGDRGSG